MMVYLGGVNQFDLWEVRQLHDLRQKLEVDTSYEYMITKDKWIIIPGMNQ